MRFSYVTTLAFEKYGAVLVLCIGIFVEIHASAR